MKTIVVKYRKRLIVLVCMLFVGSLNQALSGQDESEGTLAVYRLQALPAVDAADLVQTLIKDPNARMQVSEPVNSLIIMANQETHGMVVDLLKRIDVKNPVEKLSVEVVVLKTRPAVLVRDLTIDFMSSGKNGAVRVVADKVSNSLIVTGRPAEIDRAKAFIKVIDKAIEGKENTANEENVLVRVTWLSEGDGLGKPSTSLGELVAELEDSNQLSKVGVVTQLQSTVKVAAEGKESDPFVSSSSRRAGKTGFNLGVDGHVVVSQSSGKYDLSISMVLQASLAKHKLGSTISIPKNHPVAFCVTDVASQKSVIVVEIVDGK